MEGQKDALKFWILTFEGRQLEYCKRATNPLTEGVLSDSGIPHFASFFEATSQKWR